MYTYIYIYIHMYIHHNCIYAYIYIYIYTHIHHNIAFACAGMLGGPDLFGNCSELFLESGFPKAPGETNCSVCVWYLCVP